MMYNDEKFKFIHAESADLKRAIYQLRYQTYIEEFGFFPREEHPHGLEMDEYDPYSIYVAALNEAKQVIGTVRLVLHSEQGFPIEHAGHLRYPGEKPPPERTAEVSRLAIASTYRRRSEDTGFYGVESYLKVAEGGVLPDSGAIPAEYARRQRPVVVLGLYGAMWRISKQLGLTHWYMITETALWHALYKFGLRFRQIGEPVEYHGIRVPYMASLAEVEDHLRHANPSLYEMFLIGLESQYRPKI